MWSVPHTDGKIACIAVAPCKPESVVGFNNGKLNIYSILLPCVIPQVRSAVQAFVFATTNMSLPDELVYVTFCFLWWNVSVCSLYVTVLIVTSRYFLT